MKSQQFEHHSLTYKTMHSNDIAAKDPFQATRDRNISQRELNVSPATAIESSARRLSAARRVRRNRPNATHGQYVLLTILEAALRISTVKVEEEEARQEENLQETSDEEPENQA